MTASSPSEEGADKTKDDNLLHKRADRSVRRVAKRMSKMKVYRMVKGLNPETVACETGV